MTGPHPRPADTEGVRLALADGIATLTMSNPRRKNAVTGPMWGELAEAFRWVAHDDDVRVLVITGEGDEFCSGADLSDAPEAHWLAQMRHINTGCQQDIPKGMGHVVTVPTSAPDDRRHWHHGCWEHRHRRRPGGRARAPRR